jgi:hypothetical protein
MSKDLVASGDATRVLQRGFEASAVVTFARGVFAALGAKGTARREGETMCFVQQETVDNDACLRFCARADAGGAIDALTISEALPPITFPPALARFGWAEDCRMASDADFGTSHGL